MKLQNNKLDFLKFIFFLALFKNIIIPLNGVVQPQDELFCNLGTNRIILVYNLLMFDNFEILTSK